MSFTNADILQIAMQQSAIDANCDAGDFLKAENVIVPSVVNPRARKYLSLPLDCHLISYGNNIVASVNEKYRALVTAYINRFPVEHCFETPNMHILNDELQKEDKRICFMAEYFLPDIHELKRLEHPYTTKLMRAEDFQTLYMPEWSNALCDKRPELDVLGVGAYDGDKLVGLAACSADCESMWQIGVDVCPPTGDRVLPPRSQAAWHLKFWSGGKFRFTVPRGQILNPCATPFEAGSALHGWK